MKIEIQEFHYIGSKEVMGVADDTQFSCKFHYIYDSHFEFSGFQFYDMEGDPKLVSPQFENELEERLGDSLREHEDFSDMETYFVRDDEEDFQQHLEDIRTGN